MAVFFDTGGGEIYAGPTREAVVAAMLDDDSDMDVAQITEVGGHVKMAEVDENDEPTGELIEVAQAYEPNLGSYCIASENC